jgi:hypothetical protein
MAVFITEAFNYIRSLDFLSMSFNSYRIICILIFYSLILSFKSYSQANGFGLKLGPTLGFQKWGGGNQTDPLLRWHAAVFMDSESSDSKNVIYAQLGYHVKGGGIYVPYFYDDKNNRYPGGTFGMEFHNISLDIGLKRYLKQGKWKPYYAIGLRGDYTLSTNFEIYQALEAYTCRWNYGFSVKIGTELKLSKLINGGIELNVAPDLSKQIYVPASVKVYNPYTQTSGNLGYEISTANTVVELSIYIRFLQLIEYE